MVLAKHGTWFQQTILTAATIFGGIVCYYGNDLLINVSFLCSFFSVNLQYVQQYGLVQNVFNT